MIQTRMRKAQQNNKGFSLIELIVVIAIMAILIGGVSSGMALLARGNVQKATNKIYSDLNLVRTRTLTVNADWKLVIVKEDNGYKAKTYRNDELYQTTNIGAMNIQYTDYSDSASAGVSYDLVNGDAEISFSRVNGKIASVKLGTHALNVNDGLKGIITVTRGTKSYEITLWYNTGKITSRD